MHKRFVGLVTLVAALSAPLAAQSSYNFNVNYFGGGVASLAPGSDDPNTVNLLPGDDFVWTIAAQNGGFWQANSESAPFPLMALTTPVSGDRLGGWTLHLLLGGAQQFEYIINSGYNQYQHVGTNTVPLSSGLMWDQMVLTYALFDSSPMGQILNPDAPTVDTPLEGYLSFIGPPEGFPSIDYLDGSPTATVPEPATMTLLATGLLGMAGARRRKRPTA